MAFPRPIAETLQNTLLIARPLQPSDFDELFAAASDPLIWEQHPNRNRYQRPDFENYFKGAIESGGALLVSDAVTDEVIGCSRFSDYDESNASIAIGYTFFVRNRWGTGHNYALKKLMIDYAFRYTDRVLFYIGAVNKRSQVSIERLGAIKTGEEELAYYGEKSQPNYIYSIEKSNWPGLRLKLPY